MASDIQTYLRELQAAMASGGADPALVQDALFDAEEHLQAEMAVGGVVGAGTATYETRFAAAVEGYGSPEEVAAAYLGVAPTHEVVAAYETALANGAAAAAVREVPVAAGGAAEAATAGPRSCDKCGQGLHPGARFCTGCGAVVEAAPGEAASAVDESPSEAEVTAVREAPVAAIPPAAPIPPAPPVPPIPAGVQAGMAAATAAPAASAAPPSVLRQIFGVFVDPAVYKALIYMILSLGTGIAYFTIVVTGVSTFVPLLIMIIGVPLFLLFLGAVRGIALFEGRLVEWLLGTRMPRRPRAEPPNAGFFQRILFWLKDGRTWASMVYMVLMLPLGVAYFTIAVTGLATGVGLVLSPFWGWWPDSGYHQLPHDWWFSAWGIPLSVIVSVIVGVLLLVGMMHLIKWIGRGHAAFAKAMLVRLGK